MPSCSWAPEAVNFKGLGQTELTLYLHLQDISSWYSLTIYHHDISSWYIIMISHHDISSRYVRMIFHILDHLLYRIVRPFVLFYLFTEMSANFMFFCLYDDTSKPVHKIFFLHLYVFEFLSHTNDIKPLIIQSSLLHSFILR